MSMSISRTLSTSSRFTRQLFALTVASALLGGSALAQTRLAPQDAASATVKSEAGHTVTYKQRTNYDFDDDQVEGTLVQPDTDLITGRGKAKHDSLVRPRTTFQPEMLKSVESL